MSYFRLGDPLDDFDRLDRQQSRIVRRHPICCHCEEEIFDRNMFDIEGSYYHIECAQEEFMKRTDYYIEED